MQYIYDSNQITIKWKLTNWLLKYSVHFWSKIWDIVDNPSFESINWLTWARTRPGWGSVICRTLICTTKNLMALLLSYSKLQADGYGYCISCITIRYSINCTRSKRISQYNRFNIGLWCNLSCLTSSCDKLYLHRRGNSNPVNFRNE